MTASRRTAAAALWFALALAGGPFAALAPQAARAEDPAPVDPIAESKRLAAEAKQFESVAGDGDAEMSERKAARKEAYTRLKKARELLDTWLDAHPEDQEKHDAFYCEVVSRLYWIKKMGAVDEFSERAPARPSSPPPAAGTGPAPPTPEPEPPKPPTTEEALAAVEDYARRHPGDVPGQYELYQDFLAKHPDPGRPEYGRAMAQVEVLSKRLKDVYRLVHDDDPDSLKDVDSAQTEKLLGQLLDDLEKGVPEVRVRAARFLGALGSGKAADPLIKTMKKEKSGELFDAASDALARIGGRRVCERLLKNGGDANLTAAIVGILTKILGRGGAEGRVAGEALGGFVEAIDPAERGPIFESLASAGPAGALGLARGLEFAPPGDVSKLVETMPEAGDPRVVQYLAKLMVVNAPGIRGEHSSAARRAIEKIGKPAVRYLIPHLDDASVNVWTAELLHRITGVRLKDDKRRTWEKWFRSNRRDLEAK